jgi:anti-anti-sigma factor
VLKATPFEIETVPAEGCVRLRLSGELDLAGVPALQRACEEAIAGGAPRLVIDLAELRFIDSSGLRLFILLDARSHREPWQLALTLPPEPVLAVFRLTGAEQNLPFLADDRPLAVEEADAPPANGASSALQLALRRDVEAPGIARAAISALCRELDLSGSVRQTLVLLVSEVVSNAVLHSKGPADAQIGLTADLREGNIRVAVTDAGNGFTPGERDPARADGGYGLYLLEKASSGWGVDTSGPTSVWFELPLGVQ